MRNNFLFWLWKNSILAGNLQDLFKHCPWFNFISHTAHQVANYCSKVTNSLSRKQKSLHFSYTNFLHWQSRYLFRNLIKKLLKVKELHWLWILNFLISDVSEARISPVKNFLKLSLYLSRGRGSLLRKIFFFCKLLDLISVVYYIGEIQAESSRHE